MNNEHILAQRVAELEALNASLKASLHKPAKISLKVSEKGALSVYGLGRFPATFYPEQWNTIFAKSEDIKAFIAEHKDEFSTKAAKAATPAVVI